MEKKIYVLKATVPHTLPPLLGTDALREAGKAELCVLLALSELGGATAEAIAASLGLDAAAVTAALGFWRGAGVVTVRSEAAMQEEDTKAPEDLPEARPLIKEPPAELGAADMADYIRDGGLAELIRTAEQQCGRVFNRPDLAALIRLSEDYGLNGAYILTLLAYCDSHGGAGKSIRYAERVAASLQAKGITDCASLEAYIHNEEALRSVEGGLRRMFGIGTRKLTAREAECFLRWTESFGYGEDMIGAAYDVAVGATGKASVAYTNKLLTLWHEAGITTPAEAEAYLQRERAAKAAPPRRARKTPPPADGVRASFDVGDFFQRAIDRSYKNDTTAGGGTSDT